MMHYCQMCMALTTGKHCSQACYDLDYRREKKFNFLRPHQQDRVFGPHINIVGGLNRYEEGMIL